MDMNDFRWSALARYHDAALESAVILLALARCTVDSHLDGTAATGVRATIRLMTEMHSFCQNARKALEIAKVIDKKILAVAKTMKIAGAGSEVIVLGTAVGVVTNENIIWIMGRIIHSVSVLVIEEFSDLGVTATNISSISRKKYFSFGSDKDGSTASPGSFTVDTNDRHIIDVESFVTCYAGGLSKMVEAAIQALRPPP